MKHEMLRSTVPGVARFITGTLNTARAVRRVELEVVRVLDRNHVTGRTGCIRAMASEPRRSGLVGSADTHMREL